MRLVALKSQTTPFIKFRAGCDKRPAHHPQHPLGQRWFVKNPQEARPKGICLSQGDLTMPECPSPPKALPIFCSVLVNGPAKLMPNRGADSVGQRVFLY
tara:strand:+ start:742 stop:1038 length:297 start_codon:yes stop_codon:yes gene_type:complete